MNTHFSDERSDGIRAALVDTVSETTRARLSSRRRGWLPMLGMLGVGVLVGGAVSAAALSMRAPEVAISDPQPGTPIISSLSATTIVVVSEDEVIPLSPPGGATHVRVSVTCLNAGQTTWGLDPGGSNPGVSCNDDDLGKSPVWSDIELTPTSDALYVSVERGAVSRISYEYLLHVQTAWGVNESGVTFGVAKPNGSEPDLIGVYGQNAEGNSVQGYARASDLGAFGPLWPELPSNPDEAIAWQTERDRLYPNGWDIPVFRSDGTTQIGTFHVGGGR